jgi:hypothetical protein
MARLQARPEVERSAINQSGARRRQHPLSNANNKIPTPLFVSPEGVKMNIRVSCHRLVVLLQKRTNVLILAGNLKNN